ncbi:hypothetical protein [Curtobacterium poinsettiae]|uniref:hypothetical protein n=1 Tax=Curtobacterium poinsettiae TaxID=159612 RepID=UPI002032552C|nr:hypothetical protein [Curtobacterium flaccumfaciens]
MQQTGTLASLRLGLAGLPFGAVGGADAVDPAGHAGDAARDPDRHDGHQDPPEQCAADRGRQDRTRTPDHEHDDHAASGDGDAEPERVPTLRHQRCREPAGGQGHHGAGDERPGRVVDAGEEQHHGGEPGDDDGGGPPHFAAAAEAHQRGDHRGDAQECADEDRHGHGCSGDDAHDADERADDAHDTGRRPQQAVAFLCDEVHRCPGW